VSARQGATATHSNPIWHGIFDGAYTQAGDYLNQDGTVWFIGTQRPLQPILCVETNRTLSASRPTVSDTMGTGPYGGVEGSLTLFTQWPAAVISNGANSRPRANLPADISIIVWTVLLPPIPDVSILPADLLTDTRGTKYLVIAAESDKMGWRLIAQQVTT
jgi:hypothetical protein